jgi:hypothetical protein
MEWLNSQYWAGAPVAVKAIATQQDPATFDNAIDDLNSRITKMQTDGDWEGVIALAQTAVDQLSPRLTANQLDAIKKANADALDKQRATDRATVAKVSADLGSADPSVRQAASGALQEMGARAVRPLIEELKGVLSEQAPNADREKGIMSLLAQLAPDLKGYDPSAEQAKRLATVEQWLKQTP